MWARWHRWDRRWSQRLRLDGQRTWVRRGLAVLSHTGDGLWWVFGPLAVALWGPPAWRKGAWQVLGAVLATAVVVFGFKVAFRRRRPHGEWGQMYRKTDPYSFPSGHAARALMLGVLVWGMLPPWGAALVTLWALSVAFSRVAMGVHYLSDVLAGGALGVLIGGLALRFVVY